MFTAVVLLILSSQPIDALTRLGDGNQSRDVHGSLPTYIEWIILIYVIGMQCVQYSQTCSQPYNTGGVVCLRFWTVL